MDVPPMIFTGNPLIIKPGMVFFMHMILMDSEAQLAMNLGETYLVTETGNERLGKNQIRRKPPFVTCCQTNFKNLRLVI